MLLCVHCVDLSKLASLDSRLRERYRNSSPDPDVTWLLGSAVAAYYAADDMYYRAKIIGFDDEGIEVGITQQLSSYCHHNVGCLSVMLQNLAK